MWKSSTEDFSSLRKHDVTWLNRWNAYLLVSFSLLHRFQRSNLYICVPGPSHRSLFIQCALEGRVFLDSSARRRHRLPPLFPPPPPPLFLHKKTSNRPDSSGQDATPHQQWQQTEPRRPWRNRGACTLQIWTFLRITGVISRRDTPALPLSTTGRSCRSGWTWRSGSMRVWTNSTRVRWVRHRYDNSFKHTMCYNATGKSQQNWNA